MHPVIQALAAESRFNFWLGPGCSAGLSSWSEKEALSYLRRINPQADKNATLEEAFAAMTLEARARFLHSAFNGLNWSYVSVAAMAQQDRACAVVLRTIDGVLPRLLAARDLLPPIVNELDGAATAEARESELTLFEFPLLREPDRWREPLARAAGTHPWIVAGIDKLKSPEAALFQRIAAAGTPVYWVPLWDSAAPSEPIRVVPGFDPDSFLFALAHAMTGFLPARLDASQPGESQQQALYAELETLRNASHAGFAEASSALQKLEALDDAQFDARLEAFARARVKRQRLAPMTPNTGGIELYHTAKTVGGRRADRVLALAEEEHQQMPKEGSGFRAVLQAAQGIKILHSRALLRRNAEAQRLYQQAHGMLHALPANEPRSWQSANDVAQMLSDYAATKDPAEAEPIIREAADVLDRARKGGPLKPGEERSLWITQITVWRKHAGRLEGASASQFYKEAREASELLREMKDEFMSEYNLGILAFEEARKNLAAEAELFAEGNRRFEKALALRPESRGLLQMDWGTAIAGLAREREGAESDRYFSAAFDHFALVVDSADQAFAQVQNNWGAFLLVQARKKPGEERERLLSEAWNHANIARGLQPSSAAYNLACIAAERRDWETMTHWLRRSARGPRLPSPSHTDSVTSFNPIREEAWFQQLLRELYP